MPLNKSTNRVPAASVLDAILESGSWMVRRKDVAEFTTESKLTRAHSFDFTVPRYLCSRSLFSGTETALIPLGFWWKAPGRYSCIDFTDSSGRSLSLPTSTSDADLTLAVIYEFARRILGLQDAIDLPRRLGTNLALIVRGDGIVGYNEVKNTWYPAVASSDQDDPLARLARHKAFLNLLLVASTASVLSVTLRVNLKDRQLVKLRYEETVSRYFGTNAYRYADSFRSTNTDPRLGQQHRSLQLLGLASYKFDLVNPFIRAQSYHFEIKAPPGSRFARVSAKRAVTDTIHDLSYPPEDVHWHQVTPGSDSYATVRGQLIVIDDWLNSAIICTVVAIAVLIGIARNIPTLDPTASQGVITVALLIPSIAMSVVWRRVPWLVAKLHKWLRYAFLAVGLALFYIALRVAESGATEVDDSTQKHAAQQMVTTLVDGSQIATICEIVTVCAGFVLTALLVARFNPLRTRPRRTVARLFKSKSTPSV